MSSSINCYPTASSRNAPGDMDTTDDYSVAMLDMTNSEFADDYLCDPWVDHPWYFLCRNADAGIYDARFLNQLKQDYPQYKNIIETVNPHDPKCIKDTFNWISEDLRVAIAADQVHGHAPNGRSWQRERIMSVFEGSYDENNIQEVEDEEDDEYMDEDDVEDGSGAEDADDDDDEPMVADIASVASQERNEDIQEEDCEGEDCDSDPDYVDASYSRWLKSTVRAPARKQPTGGKALGSELRHKSPSSSPVSSSYIDSSAPATPEQCKNSDCDDIPALSPDVTSSPESAYISTPSVSPTGTPHVRNLEMKSLSPAAVRVGKSNSTSKSNQIGYTTISEDLLVASWGREMGRFCRPSPSGGFECSCSHRTATMGDMTRHWQSKRHSDAAFWCKGCGGRYTRDDALKRHMRKNGGCARKVRQ